MRTCYTDRRDPSQRWAHIAPSLRPGDRVLDYGAAEGHYAAAAAALGCQVVAIDDVRLPTRLPDRVIPVRRRVAPDELVQFGMFDVVLALSVLHHLERWREGWEAVLAVTRRHLFVEVPHPDEVGVAGSDNRQLYDHVAGAGGTWLCSTPGWDRSRLRCLWRIDR